MFQQEYQPTPQPLETLIGSPQELFDAVFKGLEDYDIDLGVFEMLDHIGYRCQSNDE